MMSQDSARDAPELDEWEALHRAASARWRALNGWSEAEIAAGHLGACPFCLDRPPVYCRSCGKAGAA